MTVVDSLSFPFVYNLCVGSIRNRLVSQSVRYHSFWINGIINVFCIHLVAFVLETSPKGFLLDGLFPGLAIFAFLRLLMSMLFSLMVDILTWGINIALGEEEGKRFIDGKAQGKSDFFYLLKEREIAFVVWLQCSQTADLERWGSAFIPTDANYQEIGGKAKTVEIRDFGSPSFSIAGQLE